LFDTTLTGMLKSTVTVHTKKTWTVSCWKPMYCMSLWKGCQTLMDGY